MPAQSPLDLYLRLNHSVWNRLPPSVRNLRLVRWYAGILHTLVCRRARRRQYFGTFFMRNRPELELIRRLTATMAAGSNLRLAVMGCSIGAETYSVLWTIRSARPDLNVQISAVDNSAEVLEIGERGIYTSETCGLVGESIFERLTEQERREIFDWNGETATVKPWLREGISWRRADATDAGLIHELGPQDMVMASNFLCHMQPGMAEHCLRNIAGLVARPGYLFVLGVDLEVRAKVARELQWRPVPELLKEIHDGDPSVREDWPWEWWGLEPLNERRRDWQLRYAVAYRLNDDRSAAL